MAEYKIVGIANHGGLKIKSILSYQNGNDNTYEINYLKTMFFNTSERDIIICGMILVYSEFGHKEYISVDKLVRKNSIVIKKDTEIIPKIFKGKDQFFKDTFIFNQGKNSIKGMGLPLYLEIENFDKIENYDKNKIEEMEISFKVEKVE